MDPLNPLVAKSAAGGFALDAEVLIDGADTGVGADGHLEGVSL
jgi:hypothetical protein